MEIEQLGPYRIVRELGRGGMGVVYEGVKLETDQPAAIKLLSATLARDGSFRQRFETEIETLRKLNHPNIVRLFGFGQQEGLLFYAMELVDGHSLEQELGRGRRFDWRDVTHIGIETCRALRHAHDRGIIHRDLKPGNLLLSSDGHVKLSDFGIARLFGLTGLTHAGSVLGTAEYMAPEQAAGGPVGPRTDLYSLGGVFYVLLTRRPLFQAKSLPEILHKQQFHRPEPVSRHAPDIPAMLEAIIAQLLEKDPQRRVPNASVLARQLEAMRRGLSLGADAGNSDQLPPTREIREDEVPSTTAGPPTPDAPTPDSPTPDAPAPEPSAEAADELPETKPTGAFKGPPATDAAEERKTGGHFTPIAEEDLDRIEPDRVRPPWISPQTWALAAALIAVGMAVWFFLQDPPADALYKKITDQAADKTINSLLAAEDDIGRFLLLYPADSRAQDLRKLETEIELHRLEKRLERRAKGLGSADSDRNGGLVPIQRDYLEAINYARLDPERGMAKLQALIDLYDHRRDLSGPTGKCLELAQRRLARLREQLDQQADEHLALLQARLDRAEELRQTEPSQARKMYRAVIELYQDKPWAAGAIRRARSALAALSENR